nr:bifunctional 4-hydroxy-2-oxoglutarate aldolase/2-dehydro-3-deoxy-phosphogluconate aldolase [Bartonella doshiae]
MLQICKTIKSSNFKILFHNPAITRVSFNFKSYSSPLCILYLIKLCLRHYLPRKKEYHEPKKNHLLLLFHGQSIIPILHIDNPQSAVSLAQALVKGGLRTIEITLQTPKALDAIKAITREVPESIVGAGTILNSLHYKQVERAGAKFIISPGLSNELIDCAKDSEIPLLPGALIPSELTMALEKGYSYLKFFPAEAARGIAFVQALASPFSEIHFCPTGGITQHNAVQWAPAV